MLRQLFLWSTCLTIMLLGARAHAEEGPTKTKHNSSQSLQEPFDLGQAQTQMADLAPPPGTFPGIGLIEPEVVGIGAKISIGDERYIEIHRQSRDQNIGSVVHYFHKPLFIFQERVPPLAGYPTVVQSAQKIGSLTYLTFHVIMTTDKFQGFAKGFIQENDPELKIPGHSIDPNSIVVDPWPIESLAVKVVLTEDGSHVFGTWLSPPLQAAPPILSIPIGFTDDLLKDFLKFAATGDIEFAYSYTYQNARQQYAKSVTQAAVNVSKALQNAVASINSASSGGDALIFQSQYNKFAATLAANLQTDVVATSGELIPVVQSQLLEKFIQPQTYDLNALSDPNIESQISGYLKPLLNEAVQKRTKEQASGSTHEDGVDVKLGASLFGGTFSIDKSDKDSISNSARVDFEQSTTDHSYTPTSIRTFRLSAISDQDTIEIVNSAFLIQGGDPSFSDDTPVSIDFAENKVGGWDANTHVPQFDGTLPGMAVCYFGKGTPPGYFALDGATSWPDADWAPDQIRGRPTPNSQDLLIGSSNQEGDEGTVWNGGHIDLNSSDLASALAISTTTNGTMVLSSTHERQVQTTPFSGDQIKSDDSVGPGRTLNWRIKPTCAPGPLHGVEITSCTATLDVTYELDLQAAQIVSGLAPTGNHPSVALSGVTTNPPNLRCRWIVKK